MCWQGPCHISQTLSGSSNRTIKEVVNMKWLRSDRTMNMLKRLAKLKKTGYFSLSEGRVGGTTEIPQQKREQKKRCVKDMLWATGVFSLPDLNKLENLFQGQKEGTWRLGRGEGSCNPISTWPKELWEWWGHWREGFLCRFLLLSIDLYISCLWVKCDWFKNAKSVLLAFTVI